MLVRAAMVVAFASMLVSEASAGPSVIVDGVTINGTVSTIDSRVDDYFGIPYATAARWSPPRKHAALNNPFDASNLFNVPVCPQNAPVVILGITLKQSEDCLSLNVFVPASANASSKLPVMVWIHGGSFENGTGVEYQPIKMVADHNMITVSINYRLGALGWLAQLDVEAGKQDAFQNAGDSGNYGLMDQQFALAWAKKNIAAFGGDPKKVTVAGESAGGFSVAAQLTSTELAAGLFRGAIIESGAYELYQMPPKVVDEFLFGNAYVNTVLASEPDVKGIQCSSLTATGDTKDVRTCLNGASVQLLLDAETADSYLETPVSGTRIAPNSLSSAYSNGDFLKVPVIHGIDINEGRLFEPGVIPFAAGFDDIVAAGGPANYDLSHANDWCGGGVCTYTQEINLALAAEGISSSVNTKAFDAKLAKKYPLKHFPDPYLANNAPSSDQALAQIGTDWAFACNAQDANAYMAQFVNVYGYEFNDPDAPPTFSDPPVSLPPNDQYGYPTASEHGAELQFLFAFPSTPNLNKSERKLAKVMRAYWANFVASSNPNKGAKVASWPLFAGGEQVQELSLGKKGIGPIGNYAGEHFCSLWEPIINP